MASGSDRRRAGQALPSGTSRLDLVLITRHPDLSRRQARAAIERGQVEVDGATVQEPGRRVAPQARVVWHPHRKALPPPPKDTFVLYRDSHVIVIDKPAGLLSVPTSAAGLATEDTALARTAELLRRAPRHRPYVERVHRLDRGTSGAMAFALSPAARSGLIEAFRSHDIERVYLALVAGHPLRTSGTIAAPIRSTYRAGRRGVARAGEPARPARTHWRVLRLLRGAALIEARPETGRQHQIRAHLAHAAMPILGDKVYGPDERGTAAGRTMLHAQRLAFRHPISGDPIAAESPLPDDFRALMSRLGARDR